MGKHNTADPTKLCGRIQRARLLMGWSQWKLALEAGLSVEAVKASEERNKFGRFDTMIKIAEALDVSIYYLAGRQDNLGTFGQ
jgi:transcriptional regulator with XRE-family HTH domain